MKKLSGDMKDIKKAQVKLQKMNLIKHKMKNYSRWNLWHVREDKVSKCDNIELQQTERTFLKMSRESLSCGETTSGFLCMYWTLHRRGDSGVYRKMFEDITAESFPSFMKPTNPGSSTSPKHKKHQVKYTKTHHNQMLKTGAKEKIMQRNKYGWKQISH